MTVKTIVLTEQIASASVFSRFNGLVAPEGYDNGTAPTTMTDGNVLLGILITSGGVIRYMANGYQLESDTPTEHEYRAATLNIEIDNELGDNLADIVGKITLVTLRMWVDFYSFDGTALVSEEVASGVAYTAAAPYEIEMYLNLPVAFGYGKSPGALKFIAMTAPAFWKSPIVAGTIVSGYPT